MCVLIHFLSIDSYSLLCSPIFPFLHFLFIYEGNKEAGMCIHFLLNILSSYTSIMFNFIPVKRILIKHQVFIKPLHLSMCLPMHSCALFHSLICGEVYCLAAMFLQKWATLPHCLLSIPPPDAVPPSTLSISDTAAWATYRTEDKNSFTHRRLEFPPHQCSSLLYSSPLFPYALYNTMHVAHCTLALAHVYSSALLSV